MFKTQLLYHPENHFWRSSNKLLHHWLLIYFAPTASCKLSFYIKPVVKGVARLDGARGKKQVWRPMSEPEIFRKQIYCIGECTCGIFKTFRSHL